MRVLWVKAGKLLPVDTGGKIRSYNLLRHLAAWHEVTLLSYYGERRDLGLRARDRASIPWRGSRLDRRARRERAALRAAYPVAGPLCGHQVHFTRRPSPDRPVDRRAPLRRGGVRLLSASLNFPPRSLTPCVLFQHNVESVLWRRQAEHEPNALKRLAFSIEARKMARYERAAVARFAHVIAVSEGDREAMSVMTDPARVSVVPTGVNVSEYRAAAATTAVDPIVVFLGSMDWEANIDAVEYFCRDIWPAVRAAVPDAQFRIVGRNPHPRVLRLASTSVVVTGTVPSVLDHLKETAVFVVPLRIGGGTRLKIFEAMAAGRAVVSTSIGAEGLDVHDGRDIVLADTGARFAESVIGLLRDPLRRARIGRSAAESAAGHDWQAVAKQLEAILLRVAASADSRPGLPGGTRCHMRSWCSMGTRIRRSRPYVRSHGPAIDTTFTSRSLGSRPRDARHRSAAAPGRSRSDWRGTRAMASANSGDRLPMTMTSERSITSPIVSQSSDDRCGIAARCTLCWRRPAWPAKRSCRRCES